MAFRVRDVRRDDLEALAALHVETFNETHRGGRSGGPSLGLRLQQWRETFDSDRDWFAVVVEDDAGALVGFAKGTRHDGGVPGYGGELNKIYVLKRHHRHGIGCLLLGAAAERFLKRGVTSMLLFGDASSPSNGFYEAFGGQRLLGERGEFHGGYGWQDLDALVAACPARAVRS
jgi:ribosomal protein S18 acetylase RimI-like enzyme